MKKLVLTGSVALAALIAVGLGVFSQPDKFRGSVIDPPMPAPNLALDDQNGQMFRIGDQRGRVVLLFFGYTSCPDVCPTTLAVFKRVRAQLGRFAQAEQARFVFVTVDPERDTLERIKAYLGAFDPSFVGLTGSETELTLVWRDPRSTHYERIRRCTWPATHPGGGCGHRLDDHCGGPTHHAIPPKDARGGRQSSTHGIVQR